jgi:hypothetical protein
MCPRLVRPSTMIIVALISVGGLYSAQTPSSVVEPSEAPVLVNLAPLRYPPLALAARVWGDVEVTLEVRKDGNVESATVVSGPPFLKDAALNSARQSHFDCHDCRQSVVSSRLVYSFQLGPTRYCSTSTVAPNTEPEQASPAHVTQSQNHITVFDSPVGTCDLPAELGVKTRSPKCLYLWRCAIH